MRPSLRPSERFSVVALYGRWFARPTKTPVMALLALTGPFRSYPKVFFIRIILKRRDDE